MQIKNEFQKKNVNVFQKQNRDKLMIKINNVSFE